MATMGPAGMSFFNWNADFLDPIFSFSSPRDIIQLSYTCRTARVAIADYFRRAFNINKHLSRYFDNPADFRSLQARTGTLISGSNALQFFDRSFYPDSDLDLYVPSISAEEVGIWMSRHGYVFKPLPAQPANFFDALRITYEPEILTPTTTQIVAPRDNLEWYRMRGVANVFNFVRPYDGDILIEGNEVEEHEGDEGRPFNELKVQIITATATPLEIILNFHSTCVMNVISYENAISFYPRETFVKRRSLICATAGPRQEAAREKYMARGWAMLQYLRSGDPGNFGSAFCRHTRRVGDHYCWTIPLPLQGVTVPPPLRSHMTAIRHDNLTVNSWRTQVHGRQDEVGITFNILSSPILQHSYTIKDVEFEEWILSKLSRAEPFDPDVRVQYDAELGSLARSYYNCHETVRAFYDMAFG